MKKIAENIHLYLQKSRHSTAIIFLIICLLNLGIYLLTWHGRFVGYEGETARAAQAFFQGTYELKRAGLGAAFLYAPFIAISEMFFGGSLNLSIVPLFYSALTGGVLFLILTTLFKKRYLAALISLLASVGSMVWPYANIGMEYQAGFWLSVMFLALVKWEQSGRGIIWAGLSFALLASAKSYNVLLILPLALYVILVLKEKKQLKRLASPSLLAGLILPGLALLAAGLVANYAIYKSFAGTYTLADEFKLTIWWEGFYGYFLSIGKSIFIYNPLLLPALFFWPVFFKKKASHAWFILSSLAVLLAINAPFASWTDETWGPRKLLPVIPLLHLPLVYLVSQLNLKKLTSIFLAVILAAAVYTQFLGASYDYGKQLAILRRNDLDSLQNMRYDPALAHPVLYNTLFFSYLNCLADGESNVFNYRERSWLRLTENGEKNVNLSSGQTSLGGFDKPNYYWLTNLGRTGKMLVCVGAALFLILWLGVLSIAWRNVKNEPES